MPLGLSGVETAITAVIVFGAFVVRGMSGFGAGMIGIPLLAFVMPVHTAIALFGLLVLVLFTFLSVRDWGEVLKEELKRLMPPTLLGVVAGALLFAHLDGRLLLKLLGGFIIAYALYTLAMSRLGLPAASCSMRWAVPSGFVGALVDTLFGGGGGTLVVIYLHLRRVGQRAFRATVAALWLAEMIARALGYGAAGYYTLDMLWFCAMLLPLMAAGTWAGERLGNRISPEVFSRLLASLLLLAGMSLLLK